MKKKVLSTILIAALLLALLTATALAVSSLLRSEKNDTVSQARNVLSEKYNLTSETLGLFTFDATQESGAWIVTFHGEGYHPSLLGDYTVMLAKGKEPVAYWTYDSTDPATWRDAGLDSPIWGQPQMLMALQNPTAASEISSAMYQSTRPSGSQPTRPPSSLAENEFMWEGQILRLAKPSAEDMTQEAALVIAHQAILEDTSLSKEALDAADVMVEFYERDTSNPIWMFQLYVLNGDIEMGCGVMLDARTGEILSTGVTTGGNG